MIFMNRVAVDGDWYLFSPEEVPLLTESFGAEFTKIMRTTKQQQSVARLRLFKKMKARDLWKKHITMLYETGHPWVTWKDPSMFVHLRIMLVLFAILISVPRSHS